jgi:Fur family ferric uptake transcriptional regulator
MTAARVAEQAGVSVASTYRALALLVELGVVSETDEPGEATADPRSHHYALCTARGHHHHFVCRSCHTTIEVESEALERAVVDMERELGLRVERHDVALSGTCARCSEGGRT